MKKIKVLVFFGLLFFAASLLLGKPANAGNDCCCNKRPYYTFRSTVAGENIYNKGRNVYQIVNEKYNFQTNESVYALSRIFNVTNVTSFRFKHEIVGNGVRIVGESPIFRPNRRWWQEVYYWYNFDNVPAGDYDLISYIQVDGRGYKRLAVKHIHVENYQNNDCYNDHYNGNGYYYNVNNNNNNCNKDKRNYYARYRRNPSFVYSWTQTGRSIRQTGKYSYEMDNQSASFTTDDQVFVLTKFSELKNVQTFGVKHEIYLNGNLYKTLAGNDNNPGFNYWDYNYTQSNLGRLPAGNYEVKAYIRLNGSGYAYQNSRQFTVEYARGNCDGNYSNGNYKCYPVRNYQDRNYNPNYNQNINDYYNYEWSKTGTSVSNVNGYDYDIYSPTSQFSYQNRVAILTKLSNFKNIARYRVKYELYQNNNSLIRTIETGDKYPSDNNYAWADFGTLPTGNHTIKIFIFTPDLGYKYLDVKYITVYNNY
jgi:flagellar hook assembly protein FlgD